MAPRKSSRISSSARKIVKFDQELEEVQIESENLIEFGSFSSLLQSPVEYFEFRDLDINEQDKELTEKAVHSKIVEDVKPLKSKHGMFSRKIKLSMRRIHLLCEVSSAKYFIDYQLNNQALSAVILSCIPPHILRIFDPKMIAEGKTLKNSLAMFSTWWKNNIGLRMMSKETKFSNLTPAYSKIIELKNSFFVKSAYEDDSVKLFAILCHALGIKTRLVHSLEMISATVSKTSSENDNQSFQYLPHYWIEVYSIADNGWIPVDCIQGLVDEKTRLESKNNVHSFVIAIDAEGLLHDLTEKYAHSYDEKSYRLRKDEHDWFISLIKDLNSKKKPSTYNSFDKTPFKSLEMPKTLSAMKSHPKLILGSQLKKYEVFYPISSPIGFFKDEPVFLRENVKKVRSKDAWLSQCARIVKNGEEPIKLVSLPRKAGAPVDEPTGVQPLFGEWQTSSYVPPEIIDGLIPKNDHGNVDLFQPSMLPKGCIHVTLPGAWKVARSLRIDYADACVGFSFHGGRALPAIHGIVITEDNFHLFNSEYKNKLMESLQNDAVDLEKQVALKWIKIFKNAMIAKRLKTDSSISLSESLKSCESSHSGNVSETLVNACPSSIITFAESSSKTYNDESEIEEFDKI